MASEKILIIDDEESVLTLLTQTLAEEGYQVLTASDGESGIETFVKKIPDLVITDLLLPKLDGLAVLKKIMEIDREIPVIILTGHGSISSAIEAMRLGAFHYITKPIDLEDLRLLVGKALETHSLKQEVSWLRNETKKQVEDELIGTTPEMRELIRMIEKVATSDAPTILLQGESGTGKNFIARIIHFKSDRANHPFMEVNCASLPETLIETELFGHEKGAFTDAKQMKRGLFEVARGGTIFLDEIGEMSVPTQAKLLQAIESRKFRRVGGVEDIETDVRVIAASNRNLKEAVAARRFREDLYFRLQLIPITIPPLRSRMDDIPILVQHFIDRFNREYHKKVKGATKEAEIFLKTYSWPGNVRELKNVIERIAILENEAYIDVPYLPPEIRSGGASSTEPAPEYPIPDSGVKLDEVEKQFIVQALAKTSGNQSRAARLLGITRHTLRYRMEKFGLAEFHHRH
jgi:DNA-binding NtrC family response regulator